MTSFSRITLVALFTLSLSSMATAYEPVHHLSRPAFVGGVAAHGYGTYGYTRFGGTGSTAQESILRGRANVIRAQGENALRTSEALRNLEEAKSRHLDNDVKRLAVRQDRMRMGLADRAYRRERVQARRETQMALNRAAREIQQAIVPETVLHETQAQSKLRMAVNLLNRGNFESGVARLQEITEQYAQTEAAQRASSILSEIRG